MHSNYNQNTPHQMATEPFPPFIPKMRLSMPKPQGCMLMTTFFDPALEKPDSGDRQLLTFFECEEDDWPPALFEWKTTSSSSSSSSLTYADGERARQTLLKLPTDKDINLPEEVRTLKILGFAKLDKLAGQTVPERAIIYESTERPINLRDVILTLPKPSTAERRALAGIIATQIRSLYLHFDLVHGGLRPQSFVFFGDPKKPDLKTPYLLDWARASTPGMHEYPEDPKGKEVEWYHDAWALMVILIEIVDWEPVDPDVDAMTTEQLFQKRINLMLRAQNQELKGKYMAKVMEHGFKPLRDGARHAEKLSKKGIRRYYDVLCSAFEGGPPRDDSPSLDEDFMMV